MNTVRFGVVGLGNMGRVHVQSILDGKAPRGVVTAVADSVADLAPYAEKGIKTFCSWEEMINSGEIDAILIATPHYSHTDIGTAALQKGIHVLVEKPISVHKADCERLIAAHTDPNVKFGAMFNVRLEPVYMRLRELIQSGELGEIMRINWIITNWFRTYTYYNSGGWRATWEGEGGGVLLNQCPHNLDLLQWLFGMPKSIHAHCRFGRYHDIEVEDDVTAYLEYPNGASGVFIASTGEAPGTNRLEITCERGRVVVEDGKITWKRTVTEVTEFSKTTKESFSSPDLWEVNVPVNGVGQNHPGIIKNFVEAILDGKPLVAPAEEGLNSVELANGMLMSQFLNQKIDLPLDGARYEELLNQQICESKKRKS